MGNLYGSGVGKGRITKLQADMYQFTSYQYSVIIGLLLSDGWLIYTKGSANPRLGFKQSLDKSLYVYHVFSFLSPFCGSMPRVVISKRKLTPIYGLEFSRDHYLV